MAAVTLRENQGLLVLSMYLKCGLRRGIRGIEKRLWVHVFWCNWTCVGEIQSSCLMFFIQDWRGVFTFQALLVLPEYYLHQPRRSHHSLQLCGPWRQWSYGSTKSVTAKKIMTVSFIGPRIFSSSSRYTVTKRIVFPHCKTKKTSYAVKTKRWKLDWIETGLGSIFIDWVCTGARRKLGEVQCFLSP